MKIKLFRNMMRTALLFICIFCSVIVHAQGSIQDFINSKDLSNFKVDMLSDEDIVKYKTYLQNSGISESQAEQMAIQRGLPSSEVLKLKARVANLTNGIRTQKGTKPANTGRTVDTSNLSKPETPLTKSKSEIFGADLFNNPNINFNGNLSGIATPKNYVIGPEDEIVVDVFGYQEISQRLIVSPEGNIKIPNVGVIAVNGLTVEQATGRIKAKMIRNGYASIASGQSTLNVNIGNIRTIKVTVIGEAKNPGTYTVSSLSNLFNVLYQSGGPSEKGSLRTIELVRNNKVIAKLDAYDFLLKGMQSTNVRLEDQDVVRIPVAGILVKVKGQISRKGIYEMLPKESLSRLIDYAGGFSSKAYTASVNVLQYTDKEKKIKDVRKDDFTNYFPNNGDEVSVGEVLDRFSNRVVIDGAVYRPGEYELTQGLTLSQLLQKSDGIKDDAFKERGLIFRTNDDLSKDVVSFHVGNVVTGKAGDIFLKKDDSISIASAKEFKELYTLTVDGEVKKPGVYDYYNGITLKDLLFQTGGFTDAASAQHIEIARRVRNDSTNGKIIAEVLEIATEADLSNKGNDIKLNPWDVVMVRTNPGYKSQVTVKIEGEVAYPGTYVLSSKEERVSDIIKRAGGVTQQADKTGGSITRINNTALKENAVERIQRLKTAQDTSTQLIEDVSKPTVKIGLQLNSILESPGNSIEDITLLEGDLITIPKERRVVKVNGEVMFPTEVVYKEGASLDYYIDKAGGYTENARKSKLYVLNSNGSAAKTRKFLFFKKYPSINAGSEILVPKIPERMGKGLSTGELIALGSGLASIAGVVIAIINVSKK
jgi:protein involved in polysaccharide export with SLBB domain